MPYRGIILGFCLTVSSFAAPGDIDGRFKPKLPDGGEINSVFEQKDGRLLVAGTVPAPNSNLPPTAFFIRLRANGRLDRTFRPQRSRLTIKDVAEITERADGIGVIGSFRLEANGAWRNAVVFGRDGRLAPYTPATNFSKGTWLPDGGIAFEGFDPAGENGRIGFLDSNGAGPTYVDTPYYQSQFAWLKGMSDGDVIGFLFRPTPPPGEAPRLMYSMSAGGRNWVDAQTPIPARGPSNTLYLADDNLLRWIGPAPFHYELPRIIFDRLPRTISCLAPLSDGGVVYSVRYTVHHTNFIFRCTPDGLDDETFPTLLPNGPVTGLLALRNGQVLAWGGFSAMNGRVAKKFVRIDTQ